MPMLAAGGEVVLCGPNRDQRCVMREAFEHTGPHAGPPSPNAVARRRTGHAHMATLRSGRARVDISTRSNAHATVPPPFQRGHHPKRPGDGSGDDCSDGLATTLAHVRTSIPVVGAELHPVPAPTTRSIRSYTAPVVKLHVVGPIGLPAESVMPANKRTVYTVLAASVTPGLMVITRVVAL
jgi:hypothetical protein